MKHSRDLMDVRNIGELAFAMCLLGLLLAIIAFVMAFFLSYLLHITNRACLAVMALTFWVALNVPVYRSLRRRSALWVGEQRASTQMTYIEICSMAMLTGLSLLAGQTTGARELLAFLRNLFSCWMLCLLGYQLFLHLVLGYRVFTRDAVRWCLIGGLTICSLYSANS
jgi:hypothetical protein